jgi:hypothetical protein
LPVIESPSQQGALIDALHRAAGEDQPTRRSKKSQRIPRRRLRSWRSEWRALEAVVVIAETAETLGAEVALILKSTRQLRSNPRPPPIDADAEHASSDDADATAVPSGTRP